MQVTVQFLIFSARAGSFFGSNVRTWSKGIPAACSRRMRQSAAADDIPFGDDVIACLYILTSAVDHPALVGLGVVEWGAVRVDAIEVLVGAELGAAAGLLCEVQAVVRTVAKARMGASRERIGLLQWQGRGSVDLVTLEQPRR
jgi:hypothetical protein